MKKLLFSISLILCFNFAFADCVYSAKDKQSSKILKKGWGAQIYFTGGSGPDFIVELSGSIYSADEVLILKDDFCSYEDKALYIDGEVFDVQKVTKVD